MYLTAAVALIFGTGLSFISLKIGTALAGLVTLPFIYLLGKEVANRRVGLLAMAFAGVAYWPNVISRVALRFALYPLFVAPTLFFLVRGIRRQNSNDFIWAGFALGLALSFCALGCFGCCRSLPFAPRISGQTQANIMGIDHIGLGILVGLLAIASLRSCALG
jgi:uncharacterized membrane protein